MKSIFQAFRFVGVCLLTFACAGDVWGVEVKVEVVSAVPYTEFLKADIRTGAAQKYLPTKGTSLWLVTYKITPKWDEKTFDIRFDGKQSGVFDKDQRMPNHGGVQFDTWGTSGYESLYRDADWKTVPHVAHVRLLVEVPNDKKELTLRLMNMEKDASNPSNPPKMIPIEAALKLAGEASKPFDLSGVVEVSVLGVKMKEAVDARTYRPGSPTKKIVNEGGSVMELTVKISPKIATNTRNNQFTWTPEALGLSFGKGGRALCLGQSFTDGFVVHPQVEPIKPSAAGNFDAKTVVLYYPVPSNLKTFDVTYFGHKVASGEVK